MLNHNFGIRTFETVFQVITRYGSGIMTNVKNMNTDVEVLKKQIIN